MRVFLRRSGVNVPCETTAMPSLYRIAGGVGGTEVPNPRRGPEQPSLADHVLPLALCWRADQEGGVRADAACCRPAWLEPPVRFDAGQRCRSLSEQPRNRGCCVGETSRMKEGRLDGPSAEDRRWRLVSLEQFDGQCVGWGDLGFAQVVILLMGLDSLSVGIKALSWCSQHRSGLSS
jgi:hypothetical protein